MKRWLYIAAPIVLVPLAYVAWGWRTESLLAEEIERLRAQGPTVSLDATGADEGEAAPLYREAVATYARLRNTHGTPGALHKPPPWTPDERDEIAGFVLAFAPCFELLDQAAALPRCRFRTGFWSQAFFQDLAQLRAPLEARAILLALEGRAGEARAAFGAALRLTESVPPASVFVASRFLSAMTGLLRCLRILEGLLGPDAALRERLRAIDSRARLRAAWQHQRAGIAAWFDAVRKDHGVLAVYAVAGEDWRKWSMFRPVLFSGGRRALAFWNESLACLARDDLAGLDALADEDDGLPDFLAPHSLSGVPAEQLRALRALEADLERTLGPK